MLYILDCMHILVWPKSNILWKNSDFFLPTQYICLSVFNDLGVELKTHMVILFIPKTCSKKLPISLSLSQNQLFRLCDLQ